jgi:hypothetical protein
MNHSSINSTMISEEMFLSEYVPVKKFSVSSASKIGIHKKWRESESE